LQALAGAAAGARCTAAIVQDCHQATAGARQRDPTRQLCAAISMTDDAFRHPEPPLLPNNTAPTVNLSLGPQTPVQRISGKGV
jgi:hypothetical protein